MSWFQMQIAFCESRWLQITQANNMLTGIHATEKIPNTNTEHIVILFTPSNKAHLSERKKWRNWSLQEVTRRKKN